MLWFSKSKWCNLRFIFTDVFKYNYSSDDYTKLLWEYIVCIFIWFYISKKFTFQVLLAYFFMSMFKNWSRLLYVIQDPSHLLRLYKKLIPHCLLPQLPPVTRILIIAYIFNELWYYNADLYHNLSNLLAHWFNFDKDYSDNDFLRSKTIIIQFVLALTVLGRAASDKSWQKLHFRTILWYPPYH